MILIQYPGDNNTEELKQQIIALENTAWPKNIQNNITNNITNNTSKNIPNNEPDDEYPAELSTFASSFVIFDTERNRAVSHAMVRKTTFFHRGITYSACGLSEVVTHPDFLRRGLASRAVTSALEFMASEKPDLCIFTCEPDLVPFYVYCGFVPAEKLVLVGGTLEKPFPGSSFGLSTMIKLMSEKAFEHKADFKQGQVFIELGENQLW